jgi:hypothetical protein
MGTYSRWLQVSIFYLGNKGNFHVSPQFDIISNTSIKELFYD